MSNMALGIKFKGEPVPLDLIIIRSNGVIDSEIVMEYSCQYYKRPT